MKIVSFVILHYKDLEVTDQCVQSILRMEQQERIHIVIVDNDVYDSDDRRQIIKDRYKEIDNITVIPVKEDRGFSYANNQGYAYAREQLKSSYIIVANNDIEFLQRDFIDLLDAASLEEICVLGPDIVKCDTKEHQNPMAYYLRTKSEAENTIKMNTFGLKYYSLMYPLLYWNFKRLEKQAEKKSVANEGKYSVKQKDIVPFGACLIFMPLFVQKERVAFSPETRFYYEEYLLAYRCREKGYQIVYDPSLKVLHETGAATKKSFGTERKRLKFVMQQTVDSCKIYLDCISGK